VASGSNEWEEFPATLCMTPYLGGMATVDELYFPTKGWAGLTVRTFDLEKRQWSIYWISSASGRMDVPARRPGEDLRARTAEALKPS